MHKASGIVKDILWQQNVLKHSLVLPFMSCKMEKNGLRQFTWTSKPLPALTACGVFVERSAGPGMAACSRTQAEQVVHALKVFFMDVLAALY